TGVPADTSATLRWTLTNTNNSNCTDYDDVVLTNNANPTCSAYADNPLACEGAAIQLHVSGAGGNGGPYTFVWSGADASYFSSTTSSDPTFNAPIGIYNLSVEVTETSTGCKNTCPVQVEVYNCTPNCETGFAVKTEVSGDYTVVDEDYSSCFRNDGFRRWGWVNAITAADKGTAVEFDFYAGAGRCDLSKGTNTGKVIVHYGDGATVTIDGSDHVVGPDEVVVTYELSPGFVMSEAHVYIGCDPYPTTNSGNTTVAPGQYSFNGGDLGYIQSYSTPVLEDVFGDFYVIVHGVVCESDIPDGCTPYPASPEEGGIFDPEETTEEHFDLNCSVDTGGWGRTVDFTAYPVPFENEVNIKYMFEYDTDVKIQVFDIKGALVRESVNENYVKGKVFTSKIDLSRTDNQMYFVRLTTDKGTVVKKIISSSNLSRD
ncbi:T9SS type A sorting domain-containing protein, partial [Flavobacteriaceae bacterium MJ-SS4]|uniref:T9SS type A sorting domain-containing protein n=1 Tax=Gilvirhabdus luticola TaxID=3079858 RepID=UPI0032DCD858